MQSQIPLTDECDNEDLRVAKTLSGEWYHTKEARFNSKCYFQISNTYCRLIKAHD